MTILQADARHADVFLFTKMHGAGNDFVLLDRRHPDLPPPTPAQCRVLADRRHGAGCDQILTVEAPRTDAALASYRIWNADGSSVGQCGNGARCVAAWLLREGAAPRTGFVLDSPTRSHAVQVLDDGRIRIEMGCPDFTPEHIPLHGFERQAQYTIDQDDLPVHFAAVSMGNPHAVIVTDDLDATPVQRVAMVLQQHPAFPESVNVGFVQVESAQRIRLRVYERGAGETLACGSGACAAAAVLMHAGTTDRSLDVQLPGGLLHVDWPSDGASLSLSGPATFVYEGRLDPHLFTEPRA